ncbi:MULTISPECIES: hypothetical protein [unclassified Microcoleus]|uniref:hypothetical protein n=1 Tax=unclassified Microcoleus TaxID=2642155 RepID=UPI0025CBC038|nr:MULTISPECIES: hypothetical protein [unclassified Microcoleus]
MGRWGDGEMGRWGDGEMGRWEMGRWGDGEMGRWGEFLNGSASGEDRYCIFGKRGRSHF